MKYQAIKLELFYLRKAFLQYKKGVKYLYNKYFLAKKILKCKNILEKPINNDDLSIHVLSGHKDLIMLIWSLASFYRSIDIVGELYVHSDGSLTEKDKKILKKIFPSIKIIEPQRFLEKYSQELEKYPIIKRFRTKYPQFFLLKKLIDPYFVSDKKYHLIIDSDLIWFRKPEEIQEEIQSRCQNSLMMTNNTFCYVTFRGGFRLSDESASYNSGIVLYRNENFDLGKLSNYLDRIDVDNPQNKHFIEQAGYATCLKKLKKLPARYYTIKDEVNIDTVVRHYTSPRRPLFFIEGIEILRSEFNKII
jgi:hypothetical protein